MVCSHSQQDLVPERYYHFACAMQHLPSYFEDLSTMRREMEMESRSNDNIETVLESVKARCCHVQKYLDRECDKNDEGVESQDEDGNALGDPGNRPASFKWNPLQLKVKALVDKKVDLSIKARNADDMDEADNLRERAAERRAALAEAEGVPDSPSEAMTVGGAGARRRGRRRSRAEQGSAARRQPGCCSGAAAGVT